VLPLRDITWEVICMFVPVSLCIVLSSWYMEPFQRGFFCGDESLMFPYKDDTVNVTTLRLVGILLPIFTVSKMNTLFL
jgi:hypothetical protein